MIAAGISAMSKVYLSEHANSILVKYLEAQGFEISFVSATSHTYDAVSSHPDIYMCKFDESNMFHGDVNELGFHYPDNIKFNAVVMGDYFIHNLKFTSSNLLAEAKRLNKKLIHVPQGYTKCNMAVVSDNAAITSDMGIANAIKTATAGIDLLVVEPGHVALRELPYGFLGGASGRVRDEMLFHGNLTAHPDFDKISDFVKKYNCRLTHFEGFALEDIGSIIEIRI